MKKQPTSKTLIALKNKMEIYALIDLMRLVLKDHLETREKNYVTKMEFIAIEKTINTLRHQIDTLITSEKAL